MSYGSLLAAFVAILVISLVFSMFGRGGGSLYTPVLVMLGMDVRTAISTAMFLNLVTAATAMLVFHRQKLVDYRFCAIFVPGTIAGSILGAMVSSKAPRELLLGIFAVFLYVVGGLLVVFSRKKSYGNVRSMNMRLLMLVTVFSFGVGFLASLLGVGGGLIIFPFLVLYMRYNPQMAAGANSLIVTVSSLVGLVGHAAFGHLDVRFLAITAAACVMGSAVGATLTVKASPTFVTVAFAGIMWFFATQIVLSLAGEL